MKGVISSIEDGTIERETERGKGGISASGAAVTQLGKWVGGERGGVNTHTYSIHAHNYSIIIFVVNGKG